MPEVTHQSHDVIPSVPGSESLHEQHCSPCTVIPTPYLLLLAGVPQGQRLGQAADCSEWERVVSVLVVWLKENEEEFAKVGGRKMLLAQSVLNG